MNQLARAAAHSTSDAAVAQTCGWAVAGGTVDDGDKDNDDNNADGDNATNVVIDECDYQPLTCPVQGSGDFVHDVGGASEQPRHGCASKVRRHLQPS